MNPHALEPSAFWNVAGAFFSPPRKPQIARESCVRKIFRGNRYLLEPPVRDKTPIKPGVFQGIYALIYSWQG